MLGFFGYQVTANKGALVFACFVTSLIASLIGIFSALIIAALIKLALYVLGPQKKVSIRH